MNKRIYSIFRRFDLQNTLLFLLAGLIALLWFYLEQAQEEGGYPVYSVAVLWVLQLIFLLWLGNLFLYRMIRKKYSWESSFNLRFFGQLLLTLLYSLLCINLTYYFFKDSYTELPPDRNQFILLNIYGLLFLLPVMSVQFGFLFLQKWKRAIVEQEKLKKEQIQSELITIKSHLSPHFLFNNLNILSSLIDVKNHAAQDFLDHFSEVYRYVLKNRDRELIALKEETLFLEAYNFLLLRRFPKSLQIQTDIAPQYLEYLVPPLALQIVLENALKHNKLSEKEPLRVKIFTTDAPALVIRNDLRLRTVPDYEKTGFGLENIRRRYWLIARKEIELNNSGEVFTVTLPLIKKN